MILPAPLKQALLPLDPVDLRGESEMWKFAFGMQRNLFSGSHRTVTSLCAQLLLLPPGFSQLGGAGSRPCVTAWSGHLGPTELSRPGTVWVSACGWDTSL